ncbi:hypothetical protein [Glaciecola sp. MF2-115]|uniref:hypothetical protein n=1 Tax=Glaciecola sp. MF2-115 TaxID=3384827 RepID=UPI0039A0CFD2
MALFKKNNNTELDPFTDLLFNALLTFTFLFLITLLLLNPPAKTGIIDPKAEFIITASWPDGDPNDVDIWAEGPNSWLVSYRNPEQGLMHLDRDDRGLVNDSQVINGVEVINPLNQEVLTIRGRPPGEFIVNLHYFKTQTATTVPVTVYLAEVNPKLRVLHYTSTELKQEGDEVTSLRFTISPSGKVIDINKLQKKLIRNATK